MCLSQMWCCLTNFDIEEVVWRLLVSGNVAKLSLPTASVLLLLRLS